jgi:branched-chain amino acid transport system substrate-binding protein
LDFLCDLCVLGELCVPPRGGQQSSERPLRAAALALAASLATSLAWADTPTQGVSKHEIVIGSIQDLSGPIAGFGKAVRLGMLLRVDEANEQGGVNGRKIKLLVEDDAYDPKKAVLAAQKLVNQDKIFAMVAHIGTAQNMAAMPIQFEKNVFNFFPVTAASEMYEPFHKLKYSFAATYFDQMRTSLPKLAKDRNAKKVCILYQDDDFGLEVMRGAEAGLKTLGMELVRSRG